MKRTKVIIKINVTNHFGLKTAFCPPSSVSVSLSCDPPWPTSAPVIRAVLRWRNIPPVRTQYTLSRRAFISFSYFFKQRTVYCGQERYLYHIFIFKIKAYQINHLLLLLLITLEASQDFVSILIFFKLIWFVQLSYFFSKLILIFI